MMMCFAECMIHKPDALCFLSFDPVGWLQILGNLYPHNPGKARKAVSHFKDAAGRSEKDPEVWEMLGELLAATDPSG